MEHKKTLGQFFTTNQHYILSGMKIPDNVLNIIEPFAGEEHLLNFITDKSRYNIECFDIDPKKKYIIQLDTINFPPSYSNKFIITNPPYLARNKSESKVAFDNYDTNDLFKCFLKNLTVNHCLGGIVVVPLNFWSSIRKKDILLRKSFLMQYKIILLNIFEENVFDDTSYTVCSFQFEKIQDQHEICLPITIYPSKTEFITKLNDTNNYLIGGEIYHLPTKGFFKIFRLTKNNLDKQNTNILVKCIDDNLMSKIGLSMVLDEDIYIDTTPNNTARTYATLVIEPKIDIMTQNIVVEKFNTLLDEYRNKYNSLFLSNYRESKDLARKRISFDLVYSLVEHILDFKLVL
jgi:hypothetical protein